MEEIWKPVVGFDRYEVSNLGRVRYVRVLSPSLTRFGYQRVTLTRAGARTRGHHVHRIVLAAFRGACPDGMEGCHNNGVRTDNRLENLRWDTRISNFADRDKHGTTAVGQRNGNSALTEAGVRYALSLRDKYPAATIAAVLGVNEGTIWAIFKGRSWKHIPR